MAQFKEILVFGTAHFLSDVYGKKFYGTFEGDVNGTAARAIKANQDNLGQSIDGTYIKDATVDGNVVTFTKGNGSTFSISTQDTHVNVIDSLASTSTTDALSANMGRVLEGEIDTLRVAATWSTY